MVIMEQTPRRLSLSEQHSMKEAIKNFNKDQLQELFRVIHSNNQEYTKNANGIFINLKQINNKTLLEMKQYVDYIQQTNDELKKRGQKK